MSKSTMVGGGAIKRPIITLPKKSLAVVSPVPAAKPQLTAVSSSRPTMIPSEPPASFPFFLAEELRRAVQTESWSDAS